MTAADWVFYKKDGVTEICTIPAHVQVEQAGNLEKRFKFMLLNETDYDMLLAMCRNAEPANCSRTTLKEGMMWVDRSPLQSNTVRVVDPDGINSGYGIVYDYNLQRVPSSGDSFFLFELVLLWMGKSLGIELNDGVYRIDSSMYAFPYTFPVHLA